MKLWPKMMRWMMTLSVIALASGCGATPTGDYCDIAQRPFQWRSDAEIDATPARVIRYVEDGASIWDSQGCGPK